MFCCKFLQQTLPAPIKIYLCSKKEPGSFPALFYALLLILFLMLFYCAFTAFANIFATAQQRGSTTSQKAQAARQLRKTVAKDGCLKRIRKANAKGRRAAYFQSCLRLFIALFFCGSYFRLKPFRRFDGISLSA